MKNLPKLSDLGGLKAMQFAIVRDEEGNPVLMANDIVSAYVAFVRQRSADGGSPISFARWMHSDTDADWSSSRHAA